MKKLFLLTISLWCAQAIYAQDLQKEINQQVWKPFKEAYSQFNTEKFMAVHSKDIVRVPRDQKQIFSFTEYKKNIERENQFNKNYNIEAAIEFRFLERIHSKQLAFETGIYQLKVKENTGKRATFYGKFQVVIRKENGTWKLLVDSDTSTEGTAIGEKDFMAAEAME